MHINAQVDLRHLNTFHVSAKAAYHVQVVNVAELIESLAWARQRELPFMLLGQGSNILFQHDYPGLVIEVQLRGIRLLSQNDAYTDVEAMAGENWHGFVMHCLDQGFYGLENLSLIPGTVGAAPVQNIGAYGVEIKDSLLALQALDIASGELKNFSNAECEFSYRSSVFKRELLGRYVICNVTFRLPREPRVSIAYPALKQALAGVEPDELTPRLVSETICHIRRSKLPDPEQLGNAGSFFWNPHVSEEQFAELRVRWPSLPGYPEQQGIKIPAAWLIEQAGWKGYREGEVGVHDKHALVLVNHGAASGAELLALSRRIQASVLAMFGINLQPEVRII
jgi:UDP-N-acetylmuramate dehydrogenase